MLGKLAVLCYSVLCWTGLAGGSAELEAAVCCSEGEYRLKLQLAVAGV